MEQTRIEIQYKLERILCIVIAVEGDNNVPYPGARDGEFTTRDTDGPSDPTHNNGSQPAKLAQPLNDPKKAKPTMGSPSSYLTPQFSA